MLSEIRDYMRKDYFMRYDKKRMMLIVLCLCFSSFAFGKSKAEITFDKIIATHAQIKQYDDELNRYYQQARDLYVEEEGEKLRQEQRAWLKERNASFSDLSILEKKYKERLSVLKARLEERTLTPKYVKSGGITEPKEKSYPPYPDVWGYDLSEYPAFKWGDGDIQAYRMDDGDVWFIISADYKKNPKKNVPLEEVYLDQKYILIKFFKQERIELTKKDRATLLNTFLAEKQIGDSTSHAIKFKTGETLEIYTAPVEKRCFVPNFISHYLIKKSPKGEKKVAILGSSTQIVLSRDNARCEVNAAPFFYQKLYFLPGFLVKLGDDTFLVFAKDSNLILRFDKDFNTRFQPQAPTYIQGDYINRNFFVLDYDVIKGMQAKYSSDPTPLFQTIHNELLFYFHKRFNDHGWKYDDDE